MLLLDTRKASAGYGIGGGGMFRKRTKPINQKRLFIRVYVSVMTLILAASVVALLSQNVKVRACENVTDSITVHYRGQTMKTSGNGETAGELLDRLGLELSGEDMVSCGLDTVTYDGMVITVDRVVTRQERTAAAIPHGIQRCTDETLPEGTEQVLLEGSDGEVLRTAEVTYRNGVESHRTLLSETVTKQPVSEIIGVGSAQDHDFLGHSRLIDPLNLTRVVLSGERPLLRRLEEFLPCLIAPDLRVEVILVELAVEFRRHTSNNGMTVHVCGSES